LLEEIREVMLRTSSGNFVVLELVRHNKFVSISFGDKRIDIDADSAFDLADALTMISSDIFLEMEWK
tara:strand:- start:14313 stop:14513 length:201 start_codon:yes stop_codon:yes gene_type:complete